MGCSMKVFTFKPTKNNMHELFDKAKAIFEKETDVEITFLFSSGRYNVEKFIDFDFKNCNGKKSIRLFGVSNKKTIIESTKKFGAEHFVKDGEFSYYQLPKDENGLYPKVGSFFVGDKLIPVAESKAHVIAPYYMNDNGEVVEATYGKWGNRNKFYLDVESVNALALDKHKGVLFRAWIEWHYNEFHLDRVDLNDTFVTKDGKTIVAVYVNPEEKIVTNQSLTLANRRIRICNCLSVLKLYGGYVYNREDGKLIVRTQDLDYAKKYEIGLMSRMFNLEGFEKIEIKGICFTKFNDYLKEHLSYWDGSQGGSSDLYNKTFNSRRLFPKYSVINAGTINGLTITDCAFKELSCGAISLDAKCKNVDILNNDFINIGGSAMRFGEPNPDIQEDKYLTNVNILDNYIKGTGVKYCENCAILLTRGINVKIAYNTILSSAYTAISVGWYWMPGVSEYGEKINLLNCDVSHNYIKSYMCNMLDGGAIYMLGGNALPSYTGAINFVHNNYIEEDKYTCPENKFFSGLYHDGASSNWHDADNVVVHDRSIDGYGARMFVQYWTADGNSFNCARKDGAASWNIYIKSNHYVGCQVIEEIYTPNLAHVMIDNTRNIFEEDMHLYKNIKDAMKNPNVVAIKNNAGCRR